MCVTLGMGHKWWSLIWRKRHIEAAPSEQKWMVVDCLLQWKIFYSSHHFPFSSRKWKHLFITIILPTWFIVCKVILMMNKVGILFIWREITITKLAVRLFLYIKVLVAWHIDRRGVSRLPRDQFNMPSVMVKV